ncbi:unnamed protein product [Rhizophagus irregularis]|uniref:Uncharacterized protein n=1 Tax=Rhizophagus irregularis TaxID=588596 RepID=A0A915ZPT8_9GLOM|nr:unnamed protein product [Rhizophagus irregularis]
MIIKRTKTRIVKPTNLKWYDLPKLLSLDNKVYASYRSAMCEFIAEKWNGNIPEYRKISMTKKRYLVEKYKSNNPDFSLSIGDWAIQIMMCCTINQQRKVERKVTKNVKHFRVVKNLVLEDADATNDEDANTNSDNTNDDDVIDNDEFTDDSRSINKKLDTKKSRRILKTRQDIVNSNNSEIQKSKYKVNNSKRSMQEADQGEDTQENQKSNRRSKRIANKLANSNT